MATCWPSITWMARKSNSPTYHAHPLCTVALWAVVWALAAQSLVACPFCTALGPTLAQRRERADVVVLAEAVSAAEAGKTSVKLHIVAPLQIDLKGGDTVELPLDMTAKSGSLVLLFGENIGAGDSTERTWHAVGVNEASYAYFARCPALKTPNVERLRYFARYLEHADPLVAVDAYLEFGHAPFEDVARVADVLDGQKMRRWLVDPGVPEARKGFYGLAIALAAPPEDRAATASFLRECMLAPENDFRAGFDGVLGGYLLLAGLPGLELIETRYFINADSADGDVRHALTALRFCAEYGREIPIERLAQAVAQLLNRPEFAAEAITDLARWQAWWALDQVVGLYEMPRSDERTRHAIVGYLLACARPNARTALAQLRKTDPAGVATAEQILSRTTGARAKE
jgi:hypothetical protein